MEQTVFWLALTFGVHIAMVNLGIFLALFVPYFKYKADKTGDAGLDAVARKMMRYYAATYAVAGVFGTAYTVFLLSFYPDFIGLAGHLTMIPFGIAILMIGLHFFSIAAYYYGWDKWERNVHHFIGFLLAISSLLIPLGFRAVFAFLNIPVGLQLEGPGISLDVSQALTNPTFWPLYIKSIVASITVGAIAVMAGLGLSYHKSSDENYRTAVEKVISTLTPVAVIGIVLMVILGLWYAYSLKVVPYKFNNIFASLGWKVSDGVAAYNMSWLFVLKMIFFAIQIIVVGMLYKHLKQGMVPLEKVKLFLATAFIALATVSLGEYLNAFSQYPCFIAALATPNGCIVPEGLPPRLADTLNLKIFNEMATVGPVVGITVAFMVFLIAAVIYFFYVILVKPEIKK